MRSVCGLEEGKLDRDAEIDDSVAQDVDRAASSRVPRRDAWRTHVGRRLGRCRSDRVATPTPLAASHR